MLHQTILTGKNRELSKNRSAIHPIKMTKNNECGKNLIGMKAR
jgi:hypothetical protein